MVYQIYPRSFAPTGSGPVGTLDGIRSHLDHIEWLGADAIWLSPFFRSPMADFGYDVSDYCDVDPIFGTSSDFDRLLTEAHERGIRVLIDWVPNHTSDQHPWFLASRSSRDDPRRDWYIWRDPAPDGGPPNNWVAHFRHDAAWTLDEATGQYYLHTFLAEQPDLNWANPEVEAAMHDTLRFWLDRGVDGFRMDVIHMVGKDPADLPDWPEGALPWLDMADPPHAHRIMRGLRELLDGYPGDRMMVGEVYLLDPARVAGYYGEGDELHLSFNFSPLHAKWKASTFRRHVDTALDTIDPVGWPTWVLSSHDSPRHRSRYGSEARARAAALLLTTLRGTPFLFAGEELGLEDAVVPPERVVDPGGRDGCRAPIPWTGGPDHGWGVTDAWLPWPPDADTRNVEALRREPDSILHVYRRLLGARRESPALQVGRFAWLDGPADVLAWERRHGDDIRRVAVNFVDTEQPVPALEGWTVEVSTSGRGEGAPFGGILGPDEAVVVRPA